EGRMVVPAWPGVDGVDVIGAAAPSEGGADWLPSEAYEALRIRAGIPLMGAELDERTIPGETGLVPWTVSFTKGCYTGQELVARIDSRGNRVPRRLRGLRFDGEVASGAELLTPDGSPAGTATSVAAQPRPATGGTEWVGLGYVRRGVDVHEELTAAGVAVRQVELVP
ncbi:MAG TPA: hypothetical protein VKI19_03820, partial [Acidimicrobiales bacterium]|nr:hypothetical protein [Acidimicrobiales bacterium]